MTSEATTEETKQEATKTANANAENEGNETGEQGEGIYSSALPNRLIITMNPRRRYRRLPFFVNRARKILRYEPNLTITGVDKAISMACTLVELLKRQKIAKVTKIATNMNLNPNFRQGGGNLAWGQPVPTIVFHMERDEHAGLVSDYHQRKVIEIFENRDTSHTGKIKKKTVEELDLGQVFSANPEQQGEAKRFLQKISGSDINLPDFVRYCSLLIHPLLKDNVFKERLSKLGITPNEEPNEENNEENEEVEEA